MSQEQAIVGSGRRSQLRLGVFSNRNAGGGATAAGQVMEYARACSDVEHVETDYQDVRSGLAELARREVDVVVVNGGDGTLQRVLTELHHAGLFERKPMIAPLRSGRTNMNALDIGSRRNPVRALALLREAAHAGTIAERVVERNVLRIDLGDGGPPQYGMFCGFGVIHRAIELTHSVFPHGRAQGVFGAGLVTAFLLARAALGSARKILAPDRFDIRLDDQPVTQREFKVVMATTLERFFLHIRPFWGTEPAPIRFTALPEGSLHATAAVDVLRGRVPRRAEDPSIYLSRNVHCSELRIDCGLTIDGEMFGPQAGRSVRVDATPTLSFVSSD